MSDGCAALASPGFDDDKFDDDFAVAANEVAGMSTGGAGLMHRCFDDEEDFALSQNKIGPFRNSSN